MGTAAIAAASEAAVLHPDGRSTARQAHLRYVSDERPGIRRKRSGRAFTYVAADGERVRDPEVLARIRSLGIPPAWTDVWISPHANGHIQATGRDARGRKQYRYHPRWQALRDETKYHRMLLFGQALPCIRRHVDEDLSRRGICREKVLAAVVRLLETTLIRVGNEEYARQNESYGLTTLQNEHVDVSGSTIRFHFRGKSGKACEIGIRDRRLASLIRRCQELPGQELFEYAGEDGQLCTVSSGDVNDYLRAVSGSDFTAKDFRTWAATVLAFQALRRCEPCETEAAAKRQVAQAVKSVAQRLNNTPTVCRKCYIHPAVLETYLDAARRSLLTECAEPETLATVHALRPHEAAVLEFLRSRI